MDVDAVADELYGLSPKEFTAARDARAKQAKAEGDRGAAADIAALRKPTVVAWLANQLARAYPEDIAPLTELGAALREATAALSGPELRQLSAQRQQLVHALVRQARGLARDAGQRITEDVARGLEDTLNAALADPAAAERLIQARLSDGMAVHGFDGAVEAPGASGVRGAGSRADRPTAGSSTKRSSRGRGASGAAGAEDDASAEERRLAEERAEQRAQLERDLGDAWGEARAAADERDEAVTAADGTRQALTAAQRTADRLRAELGAAEADLEAAGRDDERARSARDGAEDRAQAARQRVADLQSRLDGL